VRELFLKKFQLPVITLIPTSSNPTRASQDPGVSGVKSAINPIKIRKMPIANFALGYFSEM